MLCSLQYQCVYGLNITILNLRYRSNLFLTKNKMAKIETSMLLLTKPEHSNKEDNVLHKYCLRIENESKTSII